METKKTNQGNTKINLLFNPFDKIAGKNAALFGMLFLILIGIIGCFTNMVFPATLDAKYNPAITNTIGVLLLLQSSLVTVFIFWISGILFSKSVRFIDILGTILFAKCPYILIAVTGIFGSSLMTLISGESSPRDILWISISLLITIPSIILYVILLFNAFKVSTGLKTPKLGFVFTFTLLIAEIVSLTIASIILK